jgi:hypothetical protein
MRYLVRQRRVDRQRRRSLRILFQPQLGFRVRVQRSGLERWICFWVRLRRLGTWIIWFRRWLRDDFRIELRLLIRACWFKLWVQFGVEFSVKLQLRVRFGVFLRVEFGVEFGVFLRVEFGVELGGHELHRGYPLDRRHAALLQFAGQRG